MCMYKLDVCPGSYNKIPEEEKEKEEEKEDDGEEGISKRVW